MKLDLQRLEQHLSLLRDEQAQVSILSELVSAWQRDPTAIVDPAALQEQRLFLAKAKKNLQLRLETLEGILTEFRRLDAEIGEILFEAERIARRTAEE